MGEAEKINTVSLPPPTKQFTIPVSSADGVFTEKGTFRVLGSYGGSLAYFTFEIPHDFVSMSSCVVEVFSDKTVTDKDIDIDSNYGSLSEDYNVHSENDHASTYSFTADKHTDIDVSGILSNIVAGDRVAISIVNNESSITLKVYIVQLKFRYI